MIPKLFKAGKSFKGVFRYLSTDPKAATTERVAWTHTLNLAYDHVPSALDEMIWTARSADWLKRQAGVPTGGSKLKDPVRHFSLNWHRSEQPGREHMIETVERFMKFMKWDEHQAIIFCHTDKQPHVHVVVNAVHPETGRTLDSHFDHSRAQRWALAYEQEHTLLCEQRLIPEVERQPAPTREAWQKMKEAERQFDQSEADRVARAPEYFERGDPHQWKAKELEGLRGFQKDQRTGFFASGKQAFREARNTVFREVREEFRPEWRAFYQAKRNGAKTARVDEMKADILERQNETLERRRDEACVGLREQRDREYRSVLEAQKADRAELKARQRDGLHTYALLSQNEALPGTQLSARESEETRDAALSRFGAAAREATSDRNGTRGETNGEPAFDTPAAGNNKVRHPLDSASLMSLGGIGALAEVGERLFDGFFGGIPAKKPRQLTPQPRNDNTQARAAEQKSRAEYSEAEEAARLHAAWEERRRNRRHRDRD